VEAGQPAEGDEKRTRVEVESSSFDGFSVIWTPGAQGAPEVNIAVRFNFLSTDFSHSKGVKGIPVRLCAKTTPYTPQDVPQTGPVDVSPDICYCKVKLFRDHGAERKLSNDVAHVKKSIDKVKHQIAQAESGLKDFGKRKRGGGKPKIGDPQRPGKVQKHKRTWSMSSASSADGGAGGGGGVGRTSVEDDLHIKLQTLQDMFTSTRPVSVLYLRGEDGDDPDVHPVSLVGDAPETKPDQVRGGQDSNAGSMVSPSSSSLSLTSQTDATGSGKQWNNLDGVTTGETSSNTPDLPTKVQKTDDEGKLAGWIEATGVDQSYRPPPERTPKPVACFYLLRRSKDAPQPQQYHHAVYLHQRSVKDLNFHIAKKFGLDASRIKKTIHSLQSGLQVEIDDDVVQNLKEGQDMLLDVEEVTPPIKREWEMAVDDDKSVDDAIQPTTGGLVLRLTF
jgi:hypothetical protein